MAWAGAGWWCGQGMGSESESGACPLDLHLHIPTYMRGKLRTSVRACYVFDGIFRNYLCW